MTATTMASQAGAPTWAFEEIAPGVFAFIGGGEPNIGAVVGSEGVLAVDARATPDMAGEWLDILAGVTGKPVRWLFLTHFHAVRVMGASRFEAPWIIAHEGTARWFRERGRDDLALELRRFPRLFGDLDPATPHPVPNVTFDSRLELSLGDRVVRLEHFGLGHTAGDAAVWLPEEKVLFAGDLIEARTVPYAGDAFVREWAGPTLDRVARLGATLVVPGRGPVVAGGEVADAISSTRAYLDLLYELVRHVADRGGDVRAAYDAARAGLEPRFGDFFIFEIALRSNVWRAFEEASGRAWPSVMTVERDVQMAELLP